MIGSMSPGLNEAPSSIIWRTAMRQPASVSLSATMRSAVWQVVQALTTTSLPAPSGKSAAIAEKVHKSPNRDADRDRIYLIGYYPCALKPVRRMRPVFGLKALYIHRIALLEVCLI